jgi:hypothetical protein
MASNDVEVLDPAAPVEKNTNTESGCELDRRHFLALGVAGAAVGTALMVAPRAEAQQPSNPNGYAQVDVLNLMLQVKYLKATLYSYITQGADLPASSYVTLGTGQVFNQPAKITFSNQQITDVFNEMYYDELQQLIALRAIQGVAVANRAVMNVLGTGPSGAAPSTTTTTMTQAQAIGLARMLEDLSASAFATATIYLTGTNLAYAAQALATDGYHAGLIRLLSIQNNIPYVSTQYASVATSNTAQAAVTLNGSLTTGGSVIYSMLPTNLPAIGNVLTGTGIPPGAGAIITAVSAPANAALTAITNKNTTLTLVSKVTGLLPGMPITGTGIPANTVISAVGTNTITLSAAATTATTVAPTGFVTSGSPTVTGVSSTSGLIAGQVITGNGIQSGTTVVSFSSSAATITMSLPASATSVATITGTVTAGSPTVTALSTTSGLITGQLISGNGIPAGTTIVTLSSNSLLMSAAATASSSVTTISFSGIVTSGSATVSAVSSVSGLAVGQLIAGAGMPVGATIKTVGTNSITISANATASSTVQPTGLSTSGSNTLTSVSSVAGITVGLSITGTGIPTGTTVTALGTNTITMSAASTLTVSPVTVTCPTAQTLVAGGTALTTPTTEAVTSPTNEAITVGLTAITIAQPATVTGIFPLYVVLADNQDVQPGDPGTAALAAAGPAAIAGISPPIYQGFFNTAGAATSSANTPAGFAFTRSFQQILAVLYGYNASNSTITTQNYQGGFYPFGVSGPINSAI